MQIDKNKNRSDVKMNAKQKMLLIKIVFLISCSFVFVVEASADIPMFSDDFNDGVINSSKWIVSGDGITEADGMLCVFRDTEDDMVRINDSFNNSFFEMELSIKLDQISWQDMFHGISLLDSEGNGISFGFCQYGTFYQAICTPHSTSYYYGSSFQSNKWYRWKIVKLGEQVYIYVDDEQEFSSSVSHIKGDIFISLPGLYTDGNGGAGGAGTKSYTDYLTVIYKEFVHPEAQFIADKPGVPVGAIVKFTDLSTGPPTSWSWNFGDGQTSAEQNPSHVYTATGTYTVSLTATNPMGSDAEAKNITVNPLVNVVWVDDDYTPDGFNDGHTWGYDAFAKIQNGIDAVTSPGTVHVAAGTYTPIRPGEYKGNILIDNKNDISLQGSGAPITIIQGDHSTCAIWVVNSANIVIKNFTITNGGQLLHDEGGGIHAIGSILTVESCIITNNEAVNGGGVRGEQGSNVTIVNSIIANNRAGNHKGAVASDGLITSSTIINNVGTYDGQGGVGGHVDGLIVKNSIVWGNGDDIIPAGTWPYVPTIVTYSDIEDGDLGEGNICADPMFVDVAGSDYHLQSTQGSYHGGAWTPDANISPCIDAGDPTSPYDNEPEPNGNRINMGAYGSTNQASKSPMATPYVVSCDDSGTEQNTFDLSEDVYCFGGNLPASTSVDIYVVYNKDDWEGGDELSDVSGGYETETTGDDGSISTTQLWCSPLTQGSYDIVVDTNRDGEWNEGEPIDSWITHNGDWRNKWIGKDSEGGTTVTTNELQEAIHHWLDDIPVRDHIMSTADLQEIISVWLSG